MVPKVGVPVDNAKEITGIAVGVVDADDDASTSSSPTEKALSMAALISALFPVRKEWRMGVTSVDSSTAAAADRRFPPARPAGGKLTARPPVVRRAGGGAADATSQDAWTDAERWGGERRGGCFSRRELERRAE